MPSASGSRIPWPIPEQPTPESPTPVAVTRHLRMRFRSKKPHRLHPHLLVLGIGASGVNRHRRSFVVRDHELVREQILFDLGAGNIREHHAIDFDARGEALAGLLDHLGVVRRAVDDVHILVVEGVLCHNSADAVAPATAGFEVTPDIHVPTNAFPPWLIKPGGAFSPTGRCH